MQNKNRNTKISIEEKNSFSIEMACKSTKLMKNLRSVVESHPDETAKNFGMSIMHLLNHRHEKTLECLKYLNQNYPEISLINRRIAEIYISKDDYKTAITYLEKALKLDDEDLTARVWLGLSYYAIGNEKKGKICLSLLKDEVFVLQAIKDDWYDQEAKN